MTSKSEIERKAFSNGVAAQDSFRTLYANLLASFNSNEIADSIGAHIRLELSEEVSTTAPSYDLYLSLMERSFLSLFDRGVLRPNAPTLTGRGESELNSMRARTGIGFTPLATPEEIAQSQEESLDAEVVRDWTTLSSNEIKKKMYASPAYRAAVEKLSETDALQAGATTFSRIEGAPEQPAIFQRSR